MINIGNKEMLLIRVLLLVQTCISPFNVMYDVLFELN